MSTFNYQRFVIKAKNLLARFGAACQIDRAGVISPDVNVLLDIDVTETQLNQKIIIVADRVCIVEPSENDPLTTEDRLVINNMPYRIIQAKPVGPDGTVIMWTVIARL